VYARGKQIMDAVKAVWPDIRIMFSTSPAISSIQTPLTIPWWNGVAYANELQGSLFAGFVESAGQGPALMIDGGESYRDDTVAEWQLFRYWRATGLPKVAYWLPDDKRAGYRVSTSIGVWDYDVGNSDNYAGQRIEHLNAGLVNPTTMAGMLSNCMCAVDTYAWLYTEYFQWWGVGNPAIDPTVPQEMLDAVELGRTRGKQRRPL
jgi:hypothetical protein